MIRLYSRQGLLSGDLNMIQSEALVWLMSQEYEEETVKMATQALAMNENANPKVVENLLNQIKSNEEPEEPDWITPTEEDIAAVLSDFEG